MGMEAIKVEHKDSYIHKGKNEEKKIGKEKNAEKTEAKITNVDATYEKSKPSIEKITYEKPKKLSEEEVRAIREHQEQNKMIMLEQMVDANIKNQANSYGLSKESQELIISIFGSMEKGIPPLATTPEEAKAAISEGGVYSVDAVATRIMKMAEAVGGEDPEKVVKLREATEKGFKQAGIDFDLQTGQKLPKICEDTYKEVMKRFDEYEKKLKNQDH